MYYQHPRRQVAAAPAPSEGLSEDYDPQALAASLCVMQPIEVPLHDIRMIRVGDCATYTVRRPLNSRLLAAVSWQGMAPYVIAFETWTPWGGKVAQGYLVLKRLAFDIGIDETLSGTSMHISYMDAYPTLQIPIDSVPEGTTPDAAVELFQARIQHLLSPEYQELIMGVGAVLRLRAMHEGWPDAYLGSDDTLRCDGFTSKRLFPQIGRGAKAQKVSLHAAAIGVLRPTRSAKGTLSFRYSTKMSAALMPTTGHSRMNLMRQAQVGMERMGIDLSPWQELLVPKETP